jgi:hypothetical protein
MRISGSVAISTTACDLESLLDYLEARLNTIAAVYPGNANEFSIANKFIQVYSDCIVITPMKIGMSDPSSRPANFACRTPCSQKAHS